MSILEIFNRLFVVINVALVLFSLSEDHVEFDSLGAERVNESKSLVSLFDGLIHISKFKGYLRNFS